MCLRLAVRRITVSAHDTKLQSRNDGLGIGSKNIVNSQEEGPRGSEVPIGKWLEQIGATDICYVGNIGKTPDFSITYLEERIGVEVVRLLPSEGWDRTREIAFERELKKLINELASDCRNPRWHSWCRYDARDRCPPPSASQLWKERAREALCTKGLGGEYQLLEPSKLKGRGVVLELHPAANQGGFNGIQSDEGYGLEETIIERVVYWVGEKSRLAKKESIDAQYDQLWLILDDDVLVAPSGILGEDRSRIQERIRERMNTGLWSKVVMVSRFQMEQPRPMMPKWFWALWENPGHPALPRSPR